MSSARPSRSRRPLTVGFIGLGAMGKPMAARLLAHGFPLRIHSRTQAATKDLSRLGAIACATPFECARGADVVITMLTDGDALAQVLEGKDGVLAAFAAAKRRPSPILIDMSTVGRRAAKRAAARVNAHGARFVDAPVSGSVGPAARGELVALVGGTGRTVARARVVLDVLCRKIVHAGNVGAGQTLKVVLNGLGAHHLVAFTSMLTLGEKAGLSRRVLLDAFTTGAFATPSYLGKRDKVMRRDYTPDFSLALAAKDCALATELQDEVDLALPVHRAIRADVEAGLREGLGELDLFALEKHYARARSSGAPRRTPSPR